MTKFINILWDQGRRFLLLCAACFIGGAVLSPATPGFAGEVLLEGPALIAALRQGGHVIYLRHAATNRTAPNPELTNLKDCATQRNLSEMGRAQAAAIGKTMKDLRIPVSGVLSSPYCRCIDTARLAFGRADVVDALAFTIDKDPSEVKRRTEILRGLMATPPAPGTNSVIVSHTANLKEAAGIWPKPEGAIHVFKPKTGGGFRHVGHIPPDQWEKLAAIAAIRR